MTEFYCTLVKMILTLITVQTGAQLVAHPADSVERIEGADESDPSISPAVRGSGTLPR